MIAPADDLHQSYILHTYFACNSNEEDQCTVGHQAWFSEKKLFFTDMGRNRLIFPAKSRVNQWYDWLNEQEIKF